MGQDFLRMGIETDTAANAECPWKVRSINANYALCSTYPSILVMPRKMLPNDIRAVANFRKRGRLPALSWCGGASFNYASVWRCAQTSEGMMGNKCVQDEAMVQHIRRGCQKKQEACKDLLVIDLRPWKSAWANKVGGGGFESYEGCQRINGGIDNIHCVRDAWRAMTSAVNAAVSTREAGSWMKDVANSNWYDYIGAILRCALLVITEITNKCNVLVHCSDGWDRTAQATSLAMLCMDSEYRTQKGFLCLIQKEWCSFGHKFRTRLALGEAASSEYSPVFIQWLECVHLLLVQFPSAFEFTPAILLKLSAEVVSNRYGTFLCDSEQERRDNIIPYTVSLWADLLQSDVLPNWRNPSYERRNTTIVPNVNQVSYVVWEAYWFRFHARSAQLKRTTMMPPDMTVVALAPASAPASVQNTHAVGHVAAAAVPIAAPALAAQPDDLSVPSTAEPVTSIFANDDDDEEVFAAAVSKSKLTTATSTSADAIESESLELDPPRASTPATPNPHEQSPVSGTGNAQVLEETTASPTPPPSAENAQGNVQESVIRPATA